MSYPLFNPNQVQLYPLTERNHDLSGNFFIPLKKSEFTHSNLKAIAACMRQAKTEKRNIVYMAGAHVLRSGVQNYLFDLIDQGFIQGIALNGAGVIHDFELALIGATTESVANYLPKGQFGLWQETSRINDIVNQNILLDPNKTVLEQAYDNLGFGELMGREIAQGNYPFKHLSLLSKAFELHIPVTIHVGLGYDIIHAHSNFDPRKTALASYIDFLVFANLLQNLGVIATFGSAVMAPEVFLKALSMVYNLYRQKNISPPSFNSLVCDLHQLPEDTKQETNKANPLYYFRPWKTLLSRTLSQAGQSFYVGARHEQTIPSLWSELNA